MVFGSIPDHRKGFFDDLSGLLKIRDAAHSKIDILDTYNI